MADQAEVKVSPGKDKKKAGFIETFRDDRFLWYRTLKQMCLVGSWMSIAFVLEVTGPCIPDLKDKLGLNYEEISRAMVGTSVGLIVAAIIGGLLHERFYKHGDLLMAIGTFVGATGVVLLPWMPNMWSLALTFFCCGFQCSFLNPGGNAMVMHLWGEHSGPPMYSLHFGFGLGGLIAPQIAKPFLLSRDHLTNSTDEINLNNITTYPVYNVSGDDSNNTISAANPNLFYPFLIVGCMNFMFGIFYLAFFICGPPKGFPIRVGAKNIVTLCSPRSCASEGSCYGLAVLAVLFFFYNHVVGGEHIYGKWIFSYAIETDVAFTTNQAANLATLFWFSHMTGRLSGIVFSMFIPTTLVILLDISAAVVVAFLLCVFGHRSPTLLWILTACMGLLVSPLFPAGMLWSDLYLNVNSMTVMICMLGGSTGYMIYVYLGGFMLEYFGPRSMMYIELAYALLALLTYAGLTLIVRCYSDRHKKRRRRAEDDEKEDEKEAEIMLKYHKES